MHVRLRPRAARFFAFRTAGPIVSRAWVMVSSSPLSCWVTSMVPASAVEPSTWMPTGGEAHAIAGSPAHWALAARTCQ